MASPQESSTSSSADFWQNESLNEALNRTEGDRVVASIVKNTLAQVEGTTSPGTNEAQPQGRAERFLTDLKKLLGYLHEVIPLVRPVCEFALSFLEWAAMWYLTISPRGIRVMKQVWPTESAQIESILTSVKAHLEGAKEKFNKAMLVILYAVISPNTQQRTQALLEYEAIRSDIQPVFEICLQYIKQAQAILKTLEPKIKKETEESEKNAMKASSSAIAVAGIAALAITGAWMIAVPAALLITGGCFGISFQRRDELRNELAYYQAAITIINGLETMKSLLKLDAIFCNV